MIKVLWWFSLRNLAVEFWCLKGLGLSLSGFMPLSQPLHMLQYHLFQIIDFPPKLLILRPSRVGFRLQVLKPQTCELQPSTLPWGFCLGFIVPLR